MNGSLLVVTNMISKAKCSILVCSNVHYRLSETVFLLSRILTTSDRSLQL